jgi:hypothetical protein
VQVSTDSSLAGGGRLWRRAAHLWRHRWFLSRQAPRGMHVTSAAQVLPEAPLHGGAAARAYGR